MRYPYGDGKIHESGYMLWITVKVLYKFLKGKVGEFYNIGSNKNLNNLEITNYLLNIAKNYINLGKKVKIKFVKDRPGHDLRYALNSNKIKRKLKWKSNTKIIDGLNKTFLWYYNNQKYFKNLKEKDISKRLGS